MILLLLYLYKDYWKLYSFPFKNINIETCIPPSFQIYLYYFLPTNNFGWLKLRRNFRIFFDGRLEIRVSLAP